MDDPTQKGPAAVGDPEYWRGRAEEARTVADGMHDPEARSVMLKVAQGYDNLADRAEKSAKRVHHTGAISGGD